MCLNNILILPKLLVQYPVHIIQYPQLFPSEIVALFKTPFSTLSLYGSNVIFFFLFATWLTHGQLLAFVEGATSITRR